MSQNTVLTEIDARGFATVTLNRADQHNAFGEALIQALTVEFRRLAEDGRVRAVMLAAKGKSFSAGADLDWMKRLAAAPEADNIADAMKLAEMLQALWELPMPSIARVQGSAFGGGVGLVAACDIAIASEEARFSLTEVRLGLIPAAISPYVIAAIGRRQAARFAVTGETFDAAVAARIGLVHEVAPAGGLDPAVGRVVGALLACAPGAQVEAKRLVRDVAGRPIDADLRRLTAERIARRRATPEGREGVAAFLDKRRPAWIRDES
jgi:methylglutaconyl-CoA hydratase